MQYTELLKCINEFIKEYKERVALWAFQTWTKHAQVVPSVAFHLFRNPSKDHNDYVIILKLDIGLGEDINKTTQDMLENTIFYTAYIGFKIPIDSTKDQLKEELRKQVISYLSNYPPTVLQAIQDMPTFHGKREEYFYISRGKFDEVKRSIESRLPVTL